MLTGTLPCFNGCEFPPCLGGTEVTGTTVYCPHCGTAGPRAGNMADATDAWNRIQRGLRLLEIEERPIDPADYCARCADGMACDDHPDLSVPEKYRS